MRAIAVVAAALLASCSMVLGIENRFLDDAAGVDADADGGERDAKAPPDGASSSGAPPRADGGCPADALFCDDFERAELTPGWTLKEGAGGTVAVGEGLDGKGLVSVVPNRSAATPRPSALVERPVPLPIGSPLTIDLDLNVSAVDGVGVLDVELLHFSTPYYTVGLRVADYGAGLFLHEYGDDNGGTSAGADIPIQADLVPGRWTHVTFTFRWPADGATEAAIAFDGKVVVRASVEAHHYAKATATVCAGLRTEKIGAGAKVTIDNYVVTSR